MTGKLYRRARAATYWYNFTEAFAYAALHRKTPDNCEYKRLRYGSEKKQYVNVCSRKDLEGEKKPALIYIHGGGWVSGITEMRDTYVAEWAKRGFFTASISYTYAPVKGFPAQLQEIFAAIDFILDRADEFGIDKSKIALAGESAGGYFILEAAAVSKDSSLLDKIGVSFRRKDDFDVKALVSHCGCFDLKNLLDKSKPQSKFFDIDTFVCGFLGMEPDEARAFLETEEGYYSYPHVTKDFPAAFIISACRDYLRFEARDLAESYESLGIKYGEYEGTGIIGQHAWTIATVLPKGKECFEKSFSFVSETLGLTGEK